MWRFVGAFAKASAPRMLRKKAAPAESSLKSRSTVALKSLAFTSAPFEYLSPSRSVRRYVRPSREMRGSAAARYGTSRAPAGPLTWR